MKWNMSVWYKTNREPNACKFSLEPNEKKWYSIICDLKTSVIYAILKDFINMYCKAEDQLIFLTHSPLLYLWQKARIDLVELYNFDLLLSRCTFIRRFRI